MDLLLWPQPILDSAVQRWEDIIMEMNKKCWEY